MDLTTIRIEIRERLGELVADFFTDAEVDRAANEAARRFNAEERWPWLVTEGAGNLAADVDTFPLPDNVHINRMHNFSVDSASLARPQELERVDPGAGFRLRHAYDTRTGTPRWYYLTKAVTADAPPTLVYTIKLIPKTDVAYTVEFQYMRDTVEMTDAAHRPDLPDEYHDAVAAWAAGKLFLKETDISSKSTEQFMLYSKILEQAKNEMFTPGLDEVIAWGREHPGEHRIRDARQYVLSRIPPTLGP